MSDIITGARAALYAGKIKIAACTGVTVSQEIQTEPFEPLDTVSTQENVVVGMRATMTAQVTRFLDNPATQQGLWMTEAQAKNGGTGFTAKILDSVSKKVLMTCLDVKPTNMQTGVQSRGIVAQDLSFVMTTCYDERTNPADVGL